MRNVRFKQWIDKYVSDKCAFVEKHLIPKDENLWQEIKFDSFINERAKLILGKIKTYVQENFVPYIETNRPLTSIRDNEPSMNKSEVDENIAVLSRTCFKMDRVNAYSMIYGYRQEGTMQHTSIWADVKSRPFPALITHNKHPTRFKASRIGEQFREDHYKIPLKYIATLTEEYFITNNIELWNTVCSNGLFNIWNPEAPYDRLTESRTPASHFRICLLRIYEIGKEFSDSEIVSASTRIDHLIAGECQVKITRPVITDLEFSEIKSLLQESVAPYVTGRR